MKLSNLPALVLAASCTVASSVGTAAPNEPKASNARTTVATWQYAEEVKSESVVARTARVAVRGSAALFVRARGGEQIELFVEPFASGCSKRCNTLAVAALGAGELWFFRVRVATGGAFWYSVENPGRLVDALRTTGEVHLYVDYVEQLDKNALDELHGQFVFGHFDEVKADLLDMRRLQINR